MNLLELQSINKNYQLGETKVRALVGIDLEIQTGEFVTVWGPSGSGKTTLLNLMGFIDHPTSGSIQFQGQAIDTFSDNRKSELKNNSVGFIFQQFNLIPVLSALENIISKKLSHGSN